MPSGCWEWQGYRRKPWGYGEIGRGRTGEGNIKTHRAAWEVTHGPIPDGLSVLHSCDNPPCCNPSHLHLGTPADNVRDAVERGRVARGVSLPQTKLTNSEIDAIRQLYADGHSQSAIARLFGISQPYVSEVVNGKYRSAS